MNRLILAVAFLAAIAGAACTITATPGPVYVTYFGSAVYHVSVADTIQDKFGNSYLAQCEGDVAFTGYFTECGGSASTANDALNSSDATSADLTCSFEDNFGNILQYNYAQQHGGPVFFADGYIQETCTALGPRPLTAPLNIDKPATVQGQLSSKSITYADFAATHNLSVARTGNIQKF
jgi:hypothetical protein